MQELKTIEETPTAASPRQAKSDVGSADEHVPLLGVTTHNESTGHPSEHSQQWPASNRQLHGFGMQHHFEQLFENRSSPSQQPCPQTEMLVEPQPHEAQGSLEHAVSVPQFSQHSLTGSLPEGATMAHVSQSNGEGGGGSDGGTGRAQAAVAVVHGVSCERPDGKLLFQDVSFQVHPGQLLKLTAMGGSLNLVSADVGQCRGDGVGGRAQRLRQIQLGESTSRPMAHVSRPDQPSDAAAGKK